MTRPPWFVLAMSAALVVNGAAAIANSVLVTRNVRIYRHWLAIMETLPPHACGAVIEPHESCSMTFVIPLPPQAPRAPAVQPPAVHKS